MNVTGLRFLTVISILLLVTGCAGAGPTLTPTGTAKPLPVIVDVKKGTGGTGESYYAILDITVRNDGADGTAVIKASVTQGTTTLNSDFPVFLPRNDKQTIRLISPLKWEGGDFTYSVTVEVP